MPYTTERSKLRGSHGQRPWFYCLNNGVAHGPLLIPDRNGYPASAYHFDGIDDYINIGNQVQPPLPLTVVLWLRADILDKWVCVFRNDRVNHGSYRGGLGIHVWPDGKIGTNLYQGFSAPWNRRTYYPSYPLLKDNNWHHVCIVYENLNSISVYFDGDRHDAPLSEGYGSGMSYRGLDGAIGHHTGNQISHGDYFPGSIDEVRVYSRALSSREVQLLQELSPYNRDVYVDDDAPNDPGPSDMGISDPGEDGSSEHPFDMIQEGIDAAQDGDTVVVLSGVYWETIDFAGKSIKVTSFEPGTTDKKMVSYPIHERLSGVKYCVFFFSSFLFLRQPSVT